MVGDWIEKKNDEAAKKYIMQDMNLQTIHTITHM